MSAIEKELDFFNEKKDEVSIIKESKATSSNTATKLRQMLPTDNFLIKFKNSFKVRFSSFLATSSFIVCVSAIFLSLVLSKGYFTYFIFSLFAITISLFQLFGLSQKINQKEHNLKSQNDYEPYIDDIEYVVGLFEKNANTKVRYQFTKGYSAELETYVTVGESEYKLHNFYLPTIKLTHPSDWLRRMEWSYEDILKKIEDDSFKDMLLKIKEKDKDLWFSLSGAPSKMEVLKMYEKLFPNVAN